MAEQLEQTNTLLQDIGVKPTTAVVDLGFRGVDEACAPVQIVHRGKFKSLDWRPTIILSAAQDS